MEKYLEKSEICSLDSDVKNVKIEKKILGNSESLGAG